MRTMDENQTEEKQEKSESIVVIPDQYRAELPRMIQMNRNLMWFPTSVLNSKTAFTQKKIKITWESMDSKTKEKQQHAFEFSATYDNPMPIAEHSKLFDILLALYANNMFLYQDNEIGTLYFRMVDVAEISGKKYSNGFRMSLAEAIYRYMRCVAFWQNAYLSNGMRGNLSCTPIEETSLWDKHAGLTNYAARKRNRIASPGRCMDQNTWNVVKFNKRIADVLHNGDTRLFLSEIIKSDLRPIPYIIYRYFYAFSDVDYVERSMTTLCQNFGFASKKSTFPIWLRNQIDEIAKTQLLDDYEWPTNLKNWNEAIVRVKCKCFTRQSPIKDLSINNKIQNIDNLTNLALYEYYLEMIKRRLLAQDTITVLESLEKFGGKEMFYETLRRILKDKAAEFSK